MVWGRRGGRAAVAGVALALVLAGCSTHVNAGSAGVDKAEQALSRIDGVQSVRGNGQNSLPFAGTVSAFVTTDDDLSDEQLRRVTDEVGRWVSRTSNASVSYGAHIETDGFGFFVGRRASENAEILHVVDGLRDGGRWLGGNIRSAGESGTEQASIELHVRQPSDLVSGWDAARDAASGSGWKTVSVSAEAWNHPRKDALDRYNPDFSIANHDGAGKDGIGDPSPEVSAYRQVVAKHTVTGASVEPGRIHVHVADAADIADATAVIERAAPDTAAVVDGGAGDTD
ncbi:hypothetical protein ACO0E1_04700 [Curtobacterium sp. RRHDQ66]|uniref:hypothetical protein n=1 Tax=Curtobacterium guangdongense TaxID=3413380 RepID=UPI003BF04D9B